MIQINKKNIKKCRRTGLIIILVGIIFSGIFGYFYFPQKAIKNKYDREIKADKVDDNCFINVKGDVSCAPIYYFEVNGEKYSCKSESPSKNLSDGKDKVYFKSYNPEDCLTEYDAVTNPYMLIGFIVGCVIILVGLIFIFKCILVSRKIKKLCNNGTLFKGVNYQLVPSVPSGLMYPEVYLEIPNGEVLHLFGDVRYDKKYKVSNGKIDVLIDLNDPTNYYIDFGIHVIGEISNEVIDYNTKNPNLLKKSNEINNKKENNEQK